MEWAKAHTRNPLPIELGFSGASHPRGRHFEEFGSGHPALEHKVARRHGLSPEHVYLVGGTSLANFVTVAALCDPGDTVAVELPRYQPLAEIPRGLGARVVDVPRTPEGGLGPMPVGVALIICTSPHNPTGRLLGDGDWAALARAADAGAVVLVDEAYRELQDDPPPVAALRHPRFLTTGGITKAFGLGGLRLGWVLGAPDLLARVRRADNLVSVQCATPSLQLLDEVWPRLDALARRARRPVAANLETLRRSGLAFAEPQAGLTAFVHVGDGDRVSAALAARGVGLASGSFFGAPAHVRVYLGAQPAAFREGIARLEAYLSEEPEGR